LVNTRNNWARDKREERRIKKNEDSSRYNEELPIKIKPKRIFIIGL
jgi:hypothetical protein